MKTYLIADDGQSIMCLVCGARSWSLQDVAHRYCGNCHQYHSALEHQAEREKLERLKRQGLFQRVRAWLGFKA
jgi:hypothetical protein